MPLRQDEIAEVRAIVKEEIAAALNPAKVVKVENPKSVETEVKAGSFTKKEIDTNRYTNN